MYHITVTMSGNASNHIVTYLTYENLPYMVAICGFNVGILLYYMTPMITIVEVA